MNINIKICKNFYILYEYVKKINNEFPISLSDRNDLNEFTKKICNFGTAILAFDNEKCVGIIAGYTNDYNTKEAYISILEVDKQYRGKGISKKLLKQFEEIAINSGMTQIKLHVFKKNTKAINLYTNNKFIIKYDEKANHIESYVMRKEIMENFNILITSVGRRGYLVEYFKEVLKNKGKVYVANSSDITPAFKYADEAIVTPLIYDDKYIDFIIEYCKEKSVKMVISLFDIDLPILAKNKERFDKENIKLIVSNKEFVEICNDKWKTYNFLKTNSFNTPKTYININKLKEDLKNNILDYPIMIKPRWGMGSISVLEAENEYELDIFYEKAKRNIFNSYLKYESNEDRDNCIIMQEKLNGQEYGLDVINDLNGEYVNTIIKEKYAMRSGETDCAKTIENNNLKEIGMKISLLSKHIANLDMDVFIANGEVYILEMNARFGGGYPFSHIAGVNLPEAIIKWCMNQEVDRNLLEAHSGILSHKDINIIKL